MENYKAFVSFMISIVEDKENTFMPRCNFMTLLGYTLISMIFCFSYFTLQCWILGALTILQFVVLLIILICHRNKTDKALLLPFWFITSLSAHFLTHSLIYLKPTVLYIVITFVIYLLMFILHWKSCEKQIKNGYFLSKQKKPNDKYSLLYALSSVAGIWIGRLLAATFSENIMDYVIFTVAVLAASMSTVGVRNLMAIYYRKKYDL